MSDNGERDELLSKSKNELLLFAKRLLHPKLCPRSSLLKADIADVIQNALGEESKFPPRDPSRLEANRKQIELLGFMDNISDENAATKKQLSK
jgi:hypothetical protein